jgi:hypothetical protein
MGVSVKMDASDSGKKRWQDLAERLADPFVSPFDKPAIAAGPFPSALPSAQKAAGFC